METTFSTLITISTDDLLNNLSNSELDELVSDCLSAMSCSQEKLTKKAIFEDYLDDADDDTLADELKKRGFTDLENITNNN